MKKQLLIYLYLLIGHITLAQTGYLKINIYDYNGDNEFFFRTVRAIGTDTFNIEIDPFDVNKKYELPVGKYKIDLSDSFIKELDGNIRLVARYPSNEVVIQFKDTVKSVFSPSIDTIYPDTIQYLDLFDYEREFLCHGKECLDLTGNRYGIYMTHYCNGVGIYSGLIYNVYFEGKIIIEIKTENNQKTYFKINSWGKAKETSLSKVYGYSDVEIFLKENFSKGKLNDNITTDGKSIE